MLCSSRFLKKKRLLAYSRWFNLIGSAIYSYKRAPSLLSLSLIADHNHPPLPCPLSDLTVPRRAYLTNPGRPRP